MSATDNSSSSTVEQATSQRWDNQSGSGMKNLEQALNSGDIAQVRKTFAALQQAVQDAWIESGDVPALSHPVIQDFDSLADSLNADDLAGTVLAFAQLKQQLEMICQAQLEQAVPVNSKKRSKAAA